MEALFVLFVMIVGLLAFGAASLNWGVDSRDLGLRDR
jgi:hypothetical protein